MQREKRLVRLNVIVAIIFAIICSMAYGIDAYAASNVTLTVAGGTVEQGKDITVKITISSDVEIWAFDAPIVYDAANLEYKSGSISGDVGSISGGNGRLRIYSDTCQDKTITVTLVFNAKQPGEHKVAFADASECFFLDGNVENLNIVATAGTVKVNAPALFSSDNTLSIIYAYSVFEDGSTKPAWYWPDFSASRTSYDLIVEGNVTKLNITATANHKKATVAVSDTTLKVGSNKVTITVTAEDGSKKDYVINVTKNEKVTEPPTTQPPTTTPEEPTTTLPKEDIKVTIGSKEYILMNYSDEMTIPEGYEIYETTYKEQPVVALKGLGTEIVLMALSEDGEKTVDFIYNEKTGEFHKFNLVNVLSSQYVILEMLGDLGEIKMPNGYSLKSVNINGKVVDAYANDANALYIVYAMNWNGENALYYYDSVNNTMMKYFTVTNGDIGYSEERETTSGDEKDTTQVGGSVTDKDDKTDSAEIEKLKERQQLIITVGIVIILILLGIIIAMAVSKNKNDDDFEDDEDYDDEEAYDEEDYDDEESYDEEDYDDEESDNEEDFDDEDTEGVMEDDSVASDNSISDNTYADTTSDSATTTNMSLEESLKAYVAAELVNSESTINETESEDISTDTTNTIDTTDDTNATDTVSDSFDKPAVEESSKSVNKLLEDDSKSLETDELDMVLDDILDGLSE